MVVRFDEPAPASTLAAYPHRLAHRGRLSDSRHRDFWGNGWKDFRATAFDDNGRNHHDVCTLIATAMASAESVLK